MVVMARLGADRREQAKQSTDQNTRLEKLNAWLPTSGALYPHESRDPSECACANANAAPKLKFGPNYDLWTCSSGTRGLMVFRTSLCAATTIVRRPLCDCRITGTSLTGQHSGHWRWRTTCGFARPAQAN